MHYRLKDPRDPHWCPTAVSLSASPDRVNLDLSVTAQDGTSDAVYADLLPADARRLADDLRRLADIAEERA